MQKRRQEPQNNGEPPDRNIGPRYIEQVPPQPDADKGPHLMAEKHDPEELLKGQMNGREEQKRP